MQDKPPISTEGIATGAALAFAEADAPWRAPGGQLSLFDADVLEPDDIGDLPEPGEAGRADARPDCATVLRGVAKRPVVAVSVAAHPTLAAICNAHAVRLVQELSEPGEDGAKVATH